MLSIFLASKDMRTGRFALARSFRYEVRIQKIATTKLIAFNYIDVINMIH
jgi:hypothetical protein